MVVNSNVRRSPTVLTASEIAEFGGYCPQVW
jgi:hypothetical protein